MKVSKAEQVVNYVILLLMAAFAVAPLVGVVVSAFGHDTGAPGGFANFRAAWTQGHFGTYLRTSVLVSILVVALATGLSILAAFALGAIRFRGSGIVFSLFLLGLMMPAEAVVVPLYFDLRTMKLTDTIWAIVMPQVAQSIAFGTFWLRSYFRSSSRALVEAARLDGASTWQVLWRILVPVARGSLLTLVVLEFMWTWNEFLIPLVMVTKDSLRTAPLGLGFFQGQYTQGFALLAAGAVIVATPIVLAYVVLQRQIISGMLEGATKE